MSAPLLIRIRDLVREFGAGNVAQVLPIAIWEATNGRPDPLTRELYHALDECVRRWYDRLDPMPDSTLTPTAYCEWCERQYGTLTRDELGRLEV